MRRRCLEVTPAVVIAVLSGLVVQAQAAGPLLVNRAGEPLKWDTTAAVPFNPDLGALGALSNSEAVSMVADSFAAWEAVPTNAISFANAGALPVDVTESNAQDYLWVCDGTNPIVFDTDGSIIDFFLGTGASNDIPAFASLECYTYESAAITEALAVLNGLFVDGVEQQWPINPELTLEEFSAVIRHELGHFVGLDHTQLNLAEALDSDSTNDFAVPTMFPLLVNGTEQLSFHKDDEVSISVLYPASSFFSSTGAITGTILQPGRVRPFQGANVIARNTADPLVDATSNVSGARYFPQNPAGSPPPAEIEGLYEIFGLTPGASYTVEVEQIYSDFSGGSSVGPLDPPALLPGPGEFWNDANEAAVDPPDDPSEATPVPVSAGNQASGVDIILNVDQSAPPPENDECVNACELQQGTTSCWDDDTTTATTAADDPAQSCGSAGPSRNSNSVWYSLTASADGLVTIDTFGSDYDTVLSLYTGSCGTLTEVACSDNARGTFQSEISLQVSAGESLLVEVTDVGETPGGGTIVINASNLPPVPAGADPTRVLYAAYDYEATDGDLYTRVTAFLDSDGDLVADAGTTFMARGIPPGLFPIGTGGMAGLPGTGKILMGDAYRSIFFAYADSDGDFAADNQVNFGWGGDGIVALGLRKSDQVLFAADVWAYILTFSDSDGDGVPDPGDSTTFLPANGLPWPWVITSLDFDSAGRVFVTDPFNGQIIRYEDTNGDRVADSATIYFAGFVAPVSVAVDSQDRVWMKEDAQNCIYVLEDSDNDGVADIQHTFWCPDPSALELGWMVLAEDPNTTIFAAGFDWNTREAGIFAFVDADGDLAADGSPALFAKGGFPTALAFGTSSQACGNGVVDPGEDCDPGQDLPGDCCTPTCTFAPAGTVCRPQAGPCDVEEVCSGSSAACPADQFAPDGTPCTDDQDPCTDDICDAAGTCTHPSRQLCGDGLLCPGELCDPPGEQGSCSDGEVCNATCGACVEMQLLSGKKMVIKNRLPDDEAHNKLVFLSADRDLAMAAPGSAGDPRCGAPGGGGGVLLVESALSGQSFTQVLPCGNWTLAGREANPKGWKYRDRELDDGPCKLVLIKNHGKVKATCLGRGPSTLGYDLVPGQKEEPITVLVLTGSTGYCATFGGTVVTDGSNGRVFLARNSAAPQSCAIPPP